MLILFAMMTGIRWLCRGGGGSHGSNPRLRSLLPSLDLLKHFPPDVFRELGLELVLLDLAHICVVDALPHDLKRVDVPCLALLPSELLDQSADLTAKFNELLRVFQLPVSARFREVAELPLLDADEFVYLLSACPEVGQVGAFRVQASVEALCIEQLLAADEAGEELKTRSVADIQLVPHVQDVIEHAMVAETLALEHSVDLLEQIWRISVEENLLLEVCLQGGDDLLAQVIVSC